MRYIKNDSVGGFTRNFDFFRSFRITDVELGSQRLNESSLSTSLTTNNRIQLIRMFYYY